MRGRRATAARSEALKPLQESFLAARWGDFLYPRLAVYRGAGASHSWTWFADLLEGLGLFEADFINADEALSGLKEYDVLLFGGGDTYETARALGAEGAAILEEAVEGGSLYWGSCAGAYLVLTGVDLDPFTPFNLVPGDMDNVMTDPPQPRCMAHKYLAPYGGESVFNAVYGEVMLQIEGGGELSAPLYGGPVMSSSDGSQVLARYEGVKRPASYPWEPSKALGFISGRAAVLSRRLGEGTAYAAGPHLEHPFFPAANAFIGDALISHCRTRPPRTGARPDGATTGKTDAARLFMEIKRQISNARIAAFSLEKMPITWTRGVKVWEPAKVSMFLECAWSRLPVFEHLCQAAATADLEALSEGYSRAAVMVKSVVRLASEGEDSRAEAIALLTALKELTARFLSLYFRLRLNGMPGACS